MKNNKFILFSKVLCYFSLAGLFSCSNKEEINNNKTECCNCVREVTVKGLNTVSCKINGEPWSNCSNISGNSIGGEPTSAIDFYWHNENGFNTMAFAGNQFDDSGINSLEITLFPPSKELLTTFNQRRFRLFLDEKSKFNPGFNTQYKLDTTKSWQVNVIEFDEEKQIISGTFYGTLYASLLKKELAITEGQFDIKY